MKLADRLATSAARHTTCHWWLIEVVERRRRSEALWAGVILALALAVALWTAWPGELPADNRDVLVPVELVAP